MNQIVPILFALSAVALIIAALFKNQSADGRNGAVEASLACTFICLSVLTIEKTPETKADAPTQAVVNQTVSS